MFVPVTLRVGGVTTFNSVWVDLLAGWGRWEGAGGYAAGDLSGLLSAVTRVS